MAGKQQRVVRWDCTVHRASTDRAKCQNVQLHSCTSSRYLHHQSTNTIVTYQKRMWRQWIVSSMKLNGVDWDPFHSCLDGHCTASAPDVDHIPNCSNPHTSLLCLPIPSISSLCADHLPSCVIPFHSIPSRPIPLPCIDHVINHSDGCHTRHSPVTATCHPHFTSLHFHSFH